MKKSVIMIIISVYILSIFAVGYFGVKMAVYDEKIYVERIEVEVSGEDGPIEIKTTHDDKNNVDVKYCVLNYKEGLTLFIYPNLYPTDPLPTNKNVAYLLELGKENIAEVTAQGQVTIKSAGTVDIIVKAKDGSNKSDKIKLMIKE